MATQGSSNSSFIPSIFGKNSFKLRHNQSPIFYKTFNANDTAVVDLQNDVITVKNHYFKTGEPIKYTPSLGGTKIGISTTSPGNTIGTSFLPDVIYPIVIDQNKIRVSLASSLAQQNQFANLISIGIGTDHTLEVDKQNTKCLISIDNIIQSPISVASTVGITSIESANKLRLNSLENIKIGTILKLNNEYARVISIDYNSKIITLFRSKGILGTQPITFSNSLTYCSIISGQYNIVKDVIYFTDGPFEGKKFNYTIQPTDININTDSFNLFNSRLKLGSYVILNSQNPPEGLDVTKNYYIIKNSENNFSFANTYEDSVNGNKVNITNIRTYLDSPAVDLKLSLIDFSDGSSFNGRAFLRSNYDGNIIFDDVSQQFNGITSSFELKTSGISTVGIKSDNGILLINNIFQYPEYDESFYFDEVGVTTTKVIFNGVVHPKGNLGITSIKEYDVNIRGLPRGGMIVGYALTGGNKYQSLKPASLEIKFLVEKENRIFMLTNDNVGIAYSGSGYRNVAGYATSIFFESASGVRLSGYGTATIYNGNITAIDIVEICEYDSNIYGLYPTIKISSPVPYENTKVIGSGNGTGARVSFNINDNGDIEKFKFTNPGYGYTSGEILSILGDTQNSNQNSSDLLKIRVLEVAKDNFSAWNIGSLRKLDDLGSYANGIRKLFTFKENGQTLSLESTPGSDFDLSQNLLVFVNDVLQIPNESYIFNGGTQIEFKEPPAEGSSIKLYFYEGYSGDTEYVDIIEPIEIGDKLQITKTDKEIPENQFTRTVKRILTSDTLKTEIYNKKGLSEDSSTYRTVYFTPQGSDLIIGGERISKARVSLASTYRSYQLIKTTPGTFSGVGTDRITGINTSSINLQDYVDSTYTDQLRVVSIGSNSIGLSTYSTNDTVATTINVKIWRKI